MLATSMTLPGAAFGAGAAFMPGLALLRAVACGDLLLRRVLLSRRLDQRLDDGVVAGEPVRNDVPLLAVPLVDAAQPRALVVGAGHLERADHALEAELLDAVGSKIEMLEAPAYLLAGHRLVAELGHGRADRLGAQHRVDQATVVEH